MQVGQTGKITQHGDGASDAKRRGPRNMPGCGGSRFRWRVDEVSTEEGDDPGAGVASGRLVVDAGRGQDRLEYARHLAHAWPAIHCADHG